MKIEISTAELIELIRLLKTDKNKGTDFINQMKEALQEAVL